jgi:hypothetical protein
MERKNNRKSLLALLIPIVTCILLIPLNLGQSKAGSPVLSSPFLTAESPAPPRLEYITSGPAGTPKPLDANSPPSAIDATKEVIAALDTEIIEGYPTANCADALEMRAGYDTHLVPPGQVLRSLIWLNLAWLRPEATIHSATLRLYLSSSYDYAGHSVAITPFRVTSLWAENSVTWETGPLHGESYAPTWITHGAWGWYEFDLTTLVRNWVAGTYPNYGLMLRGPETASGWRGFATNSTTTPPYLILDYTQNPDYALTLVPDVLTIQAGQSSSSLLYVAALDEFAGNVALDVDGLPAHTNYEWGMDPILPTNTTLLTITTASDTPGGTYPFTVTGTAGSLVRTAQGTLHVVKPDFELSMAPSQQTAVAGESLTYKMHLTATDGFADSVMLSLDGLPYGTSHKWETTPITPTASTVLTITTTTDTPTGTHPFTATGTAGSLVHTTQGALHVVKPDFELSVTPAQRTVVVGESTRFTAHLAEMNGFDASVTLSVDGLPLHTSHSWAMNPVIPPASTVLAITTTIDTPTGTHPLTMTGTGDGIVHSESASLIVASEPVTHTAYLPLALKGYPPLDTRRKDPPESQSPEGQLDQSFADSPVARVALVIGIADYQHMPPFSGERAGAPGFDLAYPVPDAVELSGELGTRGGFGTAEASALYLDSQATKASIHAAIVNWLDQLEDEDTVVVISFSGHGMYAPDDNGDESDLRDEFIVPHEIEWDSVELRWLHEMAIRDDELDRWLSVLESRQIVILVDSCFSGGQIETTGDATRGLAWQPDAQGEMTAAQWRDGFTQDVQGPGRIVVTASTEDQGSWEFGELQNGVFSYFLLEALRTPGADTSGNGWVSAEEAYAYLSVRVDDYVWSRTGTHQNPQMSDGVSGDIDLVQLDGPFAACPW